MRYAIAVVLVLAVVAGLSSWGYVQTYAALNLANDKVGSLTQALQAEQARTARIQQTVLDLEKRNAKPRSDLGAAVRANPTWSDGPVPDAVSGSLCNRPGTRCKPRTVPAP